MMIEGSIPGFTTIFTTTYGDINILGDVCLIVLATISDCKECPCLGMEDSRDTIVATPGVTGDVEWFINLE